MELNRDNYYSREADWEYMSCSQYQGFLECEAAAMAKLEGRYTPPASKAFTVGNYFHTYFESEEAHRQFCAENAEEIYKKRGGGKYAEYEQADMMIATAMADPVIKNLVDMDGENEKIMTGELMGKYPWRIRTDKYIPKPAMIIDWKTVANIRETAYNIRLGQRASFVRNFDYVMRAAVYIDIEKRYIGKESDAAFLLVCLSKQDPVDKEIITVNHRQSLDIELEEIDERMPRIMAVKNGLKRARRCGQCTYCRGTKQITDFVPFYDLDPGEGGGREEEYDAYYTGPREQLLSELRT